MSDSVLCIILARGQSKRIPRKNIALLAGKPLVVYTIEAAQESHVFDRICVSTDDNEIAEVARTYNAEVPFMRPARLAQDHTPNIEVVLHMVCRLDECQSYRPDYVMVLQPTSPFRTPKDIETVMQLAWEQQADGVVSVSPVHQHPYWMKKITEGGCLIDFLPLNRAYTRSQELPPLYVLNGAIYLARREVLLKQQTFYTKRTYAYVMPPERSLDIDTPWDFYLADLILKDKAKSAREW